MIKLKHIFFFSLCLLLFSCVSRKKIIYFNQGNSSITEIPAPKPTYRICHNDILNIIITSVNPKLSEFFNLKKDGGSSEEGYIVSDSGYIYMPVLDSIKVEGLSIPEIQLKLQQLVRTHVTDATVVVKLASFQVTILGEVSSPGLITFSGTELTIIEALGMAKDISDFGNKKKVTLIRKEGDINKFVTLDLTGKDFMKSEYFYLQPNDIIYVEPLKAKNFKQNVGQISILLGFTTILFFVINTLRK